MNMTISHMVSLFLAMVVLGAVPSVSVLTVVARTTSGGFMHGLYTTLGIVLGDIFYILLAVFGLAFLADTLGPWFVILKYFGATYLFILGLLMWCSKGGQTDLSPASKKSSFLAGLFITLGDQKAILFYLGFLPAFVDLEKVSMADVGLIIALASVALIGTKLAYALVANKAAECLGRGKFVQRVNRVAGCFMMGVGVWMVLIEE